MKKLFKLLIRLVLWIFCVFWIVPLFSIGMMIDAYRYLNGEGKDIGWGGYKYEPMAMKLPNDFRCWFMGNEDLL